MTFIFAQGVTVTQRQFLYQSTQSSPKFIGESVWGKRNEKLCSLLYKCKNAKGNMIGKHVNAKGFFNLFSNLFVNKSSHYYHALLEEEIIRIA